MAVRAVLDAVAQALHDRHAEADRPAADAPGAVIADLAPPLVHRGMEPAALQDWLDGWDGPVEIEPRDVTPARLAATLRAGPTAFSAPPPAATAPRRPGGRGSHWR